jgi:DNA-directed RNA polymerase specialized sigma24 family protein
MVSACRTVGNGASFARTACDETCLEQTSPAHRQPAPITATTARSLITPSLNRAESRHRPSAPVEQSHVVLIDLPALQAGDEGAWTTAFRQLWKVALGAARHPSACLTGSESEEAASEALAQLVSQITLVRTVEELKALAATIAFRRAISLARRKSAAKRGTTSLSLNDALLQGETLLALHSPGSDGLSDVEAAEMALLLQLALSELDDGTRSLLEEKLLSGATYEELSARHRIPLGTACAKVARGLKKVRQRLENFPALAKELRAFLR